MKIREILEASILSRGLASDAVKAMGQSGVRDIAKDSDASIVKAVTPAVAKTLVGGNVVYHATDANGLKGILSSGKIRAGSEHAKQAATAAQTSNPVISITRDWNYAIGKGADTNVGRDAIIVLDRSSLEQSYRTLGTSQSLQVKGLAHPQADNLAGAQKAKSYDVDHNHTLDRQDADRVFQQNLLPPDSTGQALSRQAVGTRLGIAKRDYYTPKQGGEFEEVVVLPKNSPAMPLQGNMVGFYINPRSSLRNDPVIMADPRRLELAPGGTGRFVLANQ